MSRVKIRHDVKIRVTDPFPAVEMVEMDLRPDIVKYSDIKFDGIDITAGPKAKDQYKVWKFNAKGHYIEVWKDTYKSYNSMCVAVDGAVRFAGSKLSVGGKYPWFKPYLK